MREAFDKLDSSYFAQAEEVVRQMEKAVQDKDVAAFNEADVLFHGLIIDAADSDTARSVWDAIDQRIRMHFAVQTGRSGALPRFVDDHRDLLRTFRSGDLEASVAAIAEHINITNQPFLGFLDEAESV